MRATVKFSRQVQMLCREGVVETKDTSIRIGAVGRFDEHIKSISENLRAKIVMLRAVARCT